MIFLKGFLGHLTAFNNNLKVEMKMCVTVVSRA